jgi:hypothetical protein
MDGRICEDEETRIGIMKDSTYNTISMGAVVALVLFTVLSQHSGHAEYAFGIIALLPAAALFAAYIRALPTSASTSQPKAECVESPRQLDFVVHEENLITHRRLTLIERMRVARVYEEMDKRHSVSGRIFYGQVEFRRGPDYAPAAIIAEVVEKLCATSKEPRFEFVLRPDGSFRIQQIPAKPPAEELSAAREESAKESVDPQLVN